MVGHVLDQGSIYPHIAQSGTRKRFCIHFTFPGSYYSIKLGLRMQQPPFASGIGCWSRIPDGMVSFVYSLSKAQVKRPRAALKEKILC